MRNHRERHNRIPREEYRGICAQEECDEPVIGGTRRRYCFQHSCMTRQQRKVEAARLRIDKEYKERQVARGFRLNDHSARTRSLEARNKVIDNIRDILK